jgi:RNA polymerase sigma-70 factor (ECF subfamily)
LPDRNSSASDYATHDPDVRLMLRVRDGDAEAFEELVRRYQSRLLTLLKHLVGRRANPEDLAQDVFLRAYRARQNYSPDAKFATWLFTIAHNVARNALRSHSRRREVQVEPSTGDSQAMMPMESIAQEASGQMPTRQLDKMEMAEIVSYAIDQLGERQKMAILLAKFEGMSYADIAQTMHMSVPAVKSLLSRARTTLKDFLEPYVRHGQLPSADGSEASLSGSSERTNFS